MRFVLVAAVGLALMATAGGVVLFDDDDPRPLTRADGLEVLRTPPERDPAWMFNPANPVNQPFPGDFSTSLDGHRAVKAVQDLAFAGAQTTVVSVERMRYGEAICGL